MTLPVEVAASFESRVLLENWFHENASSVTAIGVMMIPGPK